MANIVLNPGAGGSTLATDTVAGVDNQIVKIGYSASGVAPTQVSTTNPLPVTLQTAGATQNVSVTNATLAVTQSGAWSVTSTVSGTVTANQGGAPWSENITQFGGNPVVTGTGTSGVGIPRVTVSSDSFPATQAVSGTITVTQGTAANLNATVVGTVTANAGTGSFTVVQPTAANLNATVVGTVTANQGGAPWTIKPDGTGWSLTGTSANVNVTNASIPVTGTFWQATQPVSGSVSVSNFPAIQTVSISGTINAAPISFIDAQPVYLDDQNTLLDDDGAQIVSINPNTDPATGALQGQTVSVLQSNLPRTVTGSVSVIGSVSTAVTSTPLAPNASQENAGQLQRIADLMESMLVELRVCSTLLQQQGQAVVDDADRLRNDINMLLQ